MHAISIFAAIAEAIRSLLPERPVARDARQPRNRSCMPEGRWRTIESAMTPVWTTIERFPVEHGAAMLVTAAEAAAQLLIRRDAVASATAFAKHAAIFPSGASHA